MAAKPECCVGAWSPPKQCREPAVVEMSLVSFGVKRSEWFCAAHAKHFGDHCWRPVVPVAGEQLALL